MVAIEGLLFVISFILLIVGLIKPSLIIRWGREETKTRKQIIGLFFIVFIILVLLGVAFDKNTHPKDNNISTSTTISTDETNKDLKVVEEKDGVTTYSDGSIVKETMGGTFKWTAAYKEIKNKEKKMSRDEQYDILGEDKLIKLENENLDEKKIREVVEVAKKCGINPSMFKGKYFGAGNEIYIVRVKKGLFKDDIQYGVKISEVADIRKANPDTVVEEMKNTIKTLAEKMPEYAEIELLKSTPESKMPIGELKEITPGDISQISVTYHKKTNAITKMVSVMREPTETKVRGSIYVLNDIVK